MKFKHRRTILKFLALAPIAAVAPSILFTSADTSIWSNILKHAKSDRGMQNLGNQYLGNQYLQYSTEKVTVADLVETLNNHLQCANITTNEQADTLLKNGIRNDFINEDTIDINGWRMSKVETYLAALSVLA